LSVDQAQFFVFLDLNCVAKEPKGSDAPNCDIGLPDGSGYEVVSQAKRKWPIKAIALTGFSTDEDFRRSKEAGFDSHLVNRWTFTSCKLF
jgi:CheY-like chemotaxis protein